VFGAATSGQRRGRCPAPQRGCLSQPFLSVPAVSAHFRRTAGRPWLQLVTHRNGERKTGQKLKSMKEIRSAATGVAILEF